MPLRCFRCGRTSHFASECFARFTVDGQPLGGATGYKHPRADSQRPHSTRRSGVYVLNWPDGRIYVGKSQDIDRRIRQHAEEMGVRPIEIPALTQPIAGDFESWERNETLEQMQRHGIEKVRGWMYTSTDLTEEQRDSIHSQIAEKYDLCRFCGQKGHFADRCRLRKDGDEKQDELDAGSSDEESDIGCQEDSPGDESDQSYQEYGLEDESDDSSQYDDYD